VPGLHYSFWLAQTDPLRLNALRGILAYWLSWQRARRLCEDLHSLLDRAYFPIQILKEDYYRFLRKIRGKIIPLQGAKMATSE
jgi:hypothetical protein